jgi:CHRD domain
MTTPFLRSALTALACTAAFALAAPALAETVNLKANMNASAEVPPTTSKGTGAVTATFDTASKTLSWKGSYSDLTGPPTAAHFHAGEAGKNGGVVIPIFAGSTAKSPFEGTAVLTDAQATDLLAGKWYVNVHTDANKAGEIRGQVIK